MTSNNLTSPISQNTRDCALLVLSCDPYSDLWAPFFNLLNRYWPDCPFQVYLGAGQFASPPPRVQLLRSDGGRDWSKCVIDYLGALDHKYVLVMLDDFFLRRQVHNAKILECLSFVRKKNSVQLRLIPRPGPTDYVVGEGNIGLSAIGSPYRLSTQASIWDREKLISLLCLGETIWDFEHNGNIRASQYADGFHSVRESVLPYNGFWAHHVVEKGKWLPHEKWIFSDAWINCDFTRRDVLPWRQTAIYHLAQLTMRVLNLFPWPTQIRMKLLLKSLLRPIFRTAIDRLGQAPSASKVSK